MKRLAWAWSLCFPLALGCPADDDDSMDDGSAGSGSTTQTSSPDSGNSTPGADESGDSGGGDDSSAALGCAANIDHDTTDGATEDRQVTWGSPCTEDAECIELFGEGGFCMKEAVLFELPGGYCTKQCSLGPDDQYIIDDPACDPAGGVDCVGRAPLIQVCAPQCTDDDQCTRDGYTCRNFPLIASEGDPMYCLMPDCCEETCAEE